MTVLERSVFSRLRRLGYTVYSLPHKNAVEIYSEAGRVGEFPTLEAVTVFAQEVEQQTDHILGREGE